MDRPRLRHPQGGYRLALALLLACSCVGAQEATFTASTRLARIEARAHTLDGKPLTGLKLEDFVITENDASFPPSQIARDELPLDLVLIIDTSGSMYSNIAKVASGAHAALSALKPGDRVALMSFSNRPRWRLPLTDDLNAVESAIQQLIHKKNFGGGTVVNTPIHQAAQELRRSSSTDRRRAILMLTDGQGQKGTRSKTVLKELWETDATLNAILLKPSRIARSINITNRVLAPYSVALDASVEDLAGKTAGEVMRLEDSATVFADILSRIRSRYTLYYPPPESPERERKVSVTLSPSGKISHPNAKVLGRRQYLIP